MDVFFKKLRCDVADAECRYYIDLAARTHAPDIKAYYEGLVNESLERKKADMEPDNVLEGINE